ncbi:unnamed protein product [Paramecium sonneborni]|uniref:Transmembrane protein n=1 Tax=Paramecium sonneborni TaxID=65129 RepID=A0A8S1KGP8_9CILI|nr:unnamed protein product [Paramecium sonneborni]
MNFLLFISQYSLVICQCVQNRKLFYNQFMSEDQSETNRMSVKQLPGKSYSMIKTTTPYQQQPSSQRKSEIFARSSLQGEEPNNQQLASEVQQEIKQEQTAQQFGNLIMISITILKFTIKKFNSLLR